MGQIEDLQLFTLIVDNQGISRAAEKLNIAKSAVSRRLNLLEQRFATRLIDRKPGTWELTATGRELYQRAIRLVSDMDDIANDFTDIAQVLAGPLNISVPQDFGIIYLNPALIAFKQNYPEIQLMVDFDDRTVDMARENYDFAIRITHRIDGDVIATRIGSSRHHLCASPAYLASHGTPQKPEDLHAHDLLHFGAARRANWEFIGETGKPEIISFQPIVNSNSGTFLLKAAINGLGIVILPDFICSPAITSGELVSIPPDLSVPEWGIFLVHAEDRRLNRRMRLFAEEMTAACLQKHQSAENFAHLPDH